ncbi:glycosyltransferase family 2 protein [Criibacterium bergeronii]|uniref:Glycosyltransferase family 2 protein n=1 Tax=Criibacterium bergeronii TaxID=1871336 RepID=A0A371ILL0_9FIRM|nr:glycosyltransferase family 2 protein [Criibacterium bergeronii]MBS6064158.1 glycosyltransferase family 2 protein [Peptostreptococcaceae bacterium]RDY21330.1 glycosyltransferase family 2 protein [Criibacterium bergeronii]
MNKVTLVIPNYNGIHFLKDCIDSLYENAGLPFDLIIIDNASTDGDYSFVNNYKNATFIKNQQNYGFAKAVNQGIKLAKTDYVVLLNNDTIVLKDYLKHFVNAIEQDSKIFSVSCLMICNYDRTLVDTAGDSYSLFGWAYKRCDGQKITDDKVNKRANIFSSCGGSVIYRRKIFDEIGYFDENFFAYLEDIDVSYRALIHGYRNIYTPNARVYHIGSCTTGGKYNSFKVKISSRNNVYLPYKNMPLLQLIINLPFLFIGFFVKYIFYVKKGYAKEYTSGIKEGLSSLYKIKKTKFRLKNLHNYIKIEYLLIKNLFIYMFRYVNKLIKAW